MTTSDEFNTAFILHVRPYQETSALVETFCREQGRVGMIFSRVRGGKSSKAGFLQPFQPLWISYSGHQELRSGRHLEARGASVWLTGERLFSGLYLNELLMRLLHRDDPHPTLFDCYEATLGDLIDAAVEPSLRNFERRLLAELGYAVALEADFNGEVFVPDRHYRFEPDQGFLPLSALTQGEASMVFGGRQLLAIAAGQYDDAEVRRAAKQLFRQALQPHLGNKPLMSRALFPARREKPDAGL